MSVAGKIHSMTDGDKVQHRTPRLTVSQNQRYKGKIRDTSPSKSTALHVTTKCNYPTDASRNVPRRSARYMAQK